MKQKLMRIFSVSTLGAILPLSTKASWGDGYSDAGSQDLPEGTVIDIVVAAASWLLMILGSVALIGFVISGILYLTAAGDEDRMEKAKRGMMYSIIGVIVGLLGYVIVQAVNTWLEGDDSF